MRQESPPAGAPHRLLIVDDESNFLWPLARALKVKGYEVDTAESGEQALEALGRSRYDLVLTDIKMPGMDGFELVDWLREHRPDVAVVMMTAFGSLSMRERSMNLGALSYIEKPIDLNALASFLDRFFYTPGFVGRISDIDLLDYLQLIVTTHKTKVVQVARQREAGRLVFEQGQLVHAECGELTGIEALNEMVAWPGGNFTDIPYEPPRVRTIDENSSYLLMEAARRRDERSFRDTGEASRPPASPPPGLPAPRTTPVNGGDESRGAGGPFARFRRFLDGLEALADVKGAVLLSRQGLILARGGAFPGGLEPLVSTLGGAFDEVGRVLELGNHDRGLVRLAGGEAILVEPVRHYLLGVWLTSPRKSGELARWIHERADILE